MVESQQQDTSSNTPPSNEAVPPTEQEMVIDTMKAADRIVESQENHYS